MAANPIKRLQLAAFVASAAAAIIVAYSSPASAASLSDPNYKEGFGRNVTGGVGQPVCIVTSAAETGAGTFDACFDTQLGGNSGVQNKQIVFAVPAFRTSFAHNLGSNVTIDGCANGRNGVVYDQTVAGNKNPLLIEDPADNIIIRCINFRGLGAPNAEVSNPLVAEYNFIWLANVAGGTISNVLVDRCTFFQATNKAFDLTSGGGNGTTRNVTFQRNLVLDSAVNTLIKYADAASGQFRYALSFHHNVYAHGGERTIAQVRDTIGDPTLGPVDIVNNVVYQASPGYYTTNFPDGGQVDPYALRFWNTNLSAQSTGVGRAGDADSGDTTSGNVTANVVGNVFLGNAASLEVRTDTGASEAGIFIGSDNVWSDPGANPDHNHFQASRNPSAPGTIALPWHSANAIPPQYQITVLPVSQLAAQLLPYVGAPNRTALDQQRLNDVAAVFPGSGTPIPNPPAAPSPPPTPNPSPPPAPGNLTVH